MLAKTDTRHQLNVTTVMIIIVSTLNDLGLLVQFLHQLCHTAQYHATLALGRLLNLPCVATRKGGGKLKVGRWCWCQQWNALMQSDDTTDKQTQLI